LVQAGDLGTEEELQDTGTSPVKIGDVTMTDIENSDSSVKRRLNMTENKADDLGLDITEDGILMLWRLNVCWH
jgi:hypothetical protein